METQPKDTRKHCQLELLCHFCVSKEHLRCQNEDSRLMAPHRPFFFLAVCLLLGQHSSARNDAPCQPSTWNNGYKTFIRRHVPSGTPTSLDQNDWQKYIEKLESCGRPTQSFLHPEDLDKVNAVCSKRGGKVLKENLCISAQPFTFVTVRSELDTCKIRSVQKETKHLILACEVLENLCLPVHFEGNPKSLKPDNNAKSCQDPLTRSHAPSFKISRVWLFFVPLIIIYDF